MKLKVQLILLFVIHTSAPYKIVFDCGDAEDRLRCRTSCPEGLRVHDKTCPFNRVCCLGPPRNIYTPLREAPFFSPITPRPHSNQVFNYIVSVMNKSEPLRYVEADEPNPHTPPGRPKRVDPILDDIENTIQDKPLRKSIHYCKKYKELTVEYLYATPILPKLLSFTLPMDNCLPMYVPLIVGGNNATKGEFPHMAAIGYQKDGFTDYLCGGSLISEKYILTAAHCVRTKWGPPVTALLGTTLLYSEDGLEIGIKRSIPHPDYSPPSYYNDIALLELEHEVKLSSGLRPACLPLPVNEVDKPGSITIATGWGKTGFARQGSLNLKKVALKVVANDKCEEFYANDIRGPALKSGINERLLCATGHANEYHDTCQGDSGGPLQAFIPGHNCMMEVIAITSFGKTCGTAIPGVYTKVEPYLSWIEEIVWP